MAAVQCGPPMPEFISWLFSPKPKFDCYFLVGNKSLVKPERIGAVKMMLMAHSEVLRLELEDSGLAEKGEVPVVDINPEIFKIMLKYVYGYDTTPELSFDKADDMFYVADKYMMLSLKNKLAVRLMSLLTPDNVCSLLNNPACYTQLELKSAITQILRYETDRVLASPQMLGMSAEAFVKILEQDGLVVPEIDLWRAAIKWAKNKAGSENGKDLRQQVSQLANHLKICTLTSEQFCKEVVPSDILTRDELATVCLSICTQEKQHLSTFCNDIQPRNKLQKTVKNTTNEKQDYCELILNDCTPTFHNFSSFSILTKKSAIELLPWESKAKPRQRMTPEGATYCVSCEITITRITDIDNNKSSEDPVTVIFNEQVEYGKQYMIPLSTDGRNVTLLPNNKYFVTVKFANSQYIYCSATRDFFDSDHLSLEIKSFCNGRYVYYYSPINRLLYRVVNTD